MQFSQLNLPERIILKMFSVVLSHIGKSSLVRIKNPESQSANPTWENALQI